MIAMLVPAFLMGLLGGAHCVVMCGGVAATACPRASTGLAFNLGRIATYTALGAAAGAFGGMSSSFVPVEALRVALRALAAIALLGLGLHLAGITNAFTAAEKIGAPVWKRISPLAKSLLPARTPLHAAALGAIWGFVPCGLVVAAMTLALNAPGVALGATTMLAFGLGTLPIMTLVTSLAGPVSRSLSRPMLRRTAGLFVLVLGIHQTTLAFASVDLAMGGHAAHACCHAARK